MPKKIEDILNPPPQTDPIKDRIYRIITQASNDGVAFTLGDVLRADRVNWLDIARPGEGGLALALAAAYVGHETGITERMDQLRKDALNALVAEGHVEMRKSEGKRYYFIPRDSLPAADKKLELEP